MCFSSPKVPILQTLPRFWLKLPEGKKECVRHLLDDVQYSLSFGGDITWIRLEIAGNQTQRAVLILIQLGILGPRLAPESQNNEGARGPAILLILLVLFAC